MHLYNALIQYTAPYTKPYPSGGGITIGYQNLPPLRRHGRANAAPCCFVVGFEGLEDDYDYSRPPELRVVARCEAIATPAASPSLHPPLPPRVNAAEREGSTLSKPQEKARGTVHTTAESLTRVGCSVRRASARAYPNYLRRPSNL